MSLILTFVDVCGKSSGLILHLVAVCLIGTTGEGVVISTLVQLPPVYEGKDGSSTRFSFLFCLTLSEL